MYTIFPALALSAHQRAWHPWSSFMRPCKPSLSVVEMSNHVKKTNYFNLVCNWFARTLVIYCALYGFILFCHAISSFIMLDPKPIMDAWSASLFDKSSMWTRCVFVLSMFLSGVYTRFMFDCFNEHEYCVNLLNIKRHFKK